MISIDFVGDKKEEAEKSFNEFLKEYVNIFLERSAIKDIKVEYIRWGKENNITIYLR